MLAPRINGHPALAVKGNTIARTCCCTANRVAVGGFEQEAVNAIRQRTRSRGIETDKVADHLVATAGLGQPDAIGAVAGDHIAITSGCPADGGIACAKGDCDAGIGIGACLRAVAVGADIVAADNIAAVGIFNNDAVKVAGNHIAGHATNGADDIITTVQFDPIAGVTSHAILGR